MGLVQVEGGSGRVVVGGGKVIQVGREPHGRRSGRLHARVGLEQLSRVADQGAAGRVAEIAMAATPDFLGEGGS